MTRFALAAIAALTAAAPAAVEPDIARVLSTYLKFSSAELTELQRGRVVRHAVESSSPGEIAVVGAVRVRASVDTLIKSVRDIEAFKRGPGVLEIGRFSDPPRADDLRSLTVTADDFDPSGCRVGDCDIRLSAEVIKRLPREGTNADGAALDESARWFKGVLLDHVSAYWSGSQGRMLTYDDGSRQIRPGTEFEGVLRNAPTLAALVPELPAHLDAFPARRLDGAEDFLYWSKEKFGMSPFITVTQITIVCPSGKLCVIASKDVYSSRYIDASLGLTIASVDAADPDAFYLVYMNRSRSSALKGIFSGLRKSIAERRARGSLEETLKTVKARLER